MERCPICIDGKVSVKLSSHGEEIFCMACRGIVKSATLGFIFEASGEEGVQECKGPEGDPRPGFKGPGKKAKCWLYDSGDEDSKQKAQQKARASAYAAQHKTAATKIVNATAGFTGAPAAMMPPSNPTQPLDYGATANPVAPNITTDLSSATPATGGSANSTIPSAPNGVQIGDLNKSNPLNSGTTASKRLAELIADMGDDLISEKEMGKSFCTAHGAYDRCKDTNGLL